VMLVKAAAWGLWWGGEGGAVVAQFICIGA